MKNIAILGATGTIGVNTLDVIARHPDTFRAYALTANTQLDRMLEQCRQHRPRYAVMVDLRQAEKLKSLMPSVSPETEVLAGEDGLERVASDPQTDYVMAAIVGAAGLKSTLAAARAGKRILLANKEALVMSGQLFMDEIRKHHAQLLPIDSEHNAIFQCLPHDYSSCDTAGVEKILLTGSGGPLRKTPLEQFSAITPEQAIAHPNWSMGRKISVDSATMMNKGLEIIEACWLFNLAPQQIEVVIHPQSIIHSMVQYTDGSVLAQLGQPDMRTPIAHAMAWPERISSGVKPLNMFDIARLEFERPDMQRYPCLQLAQDAARTGGTASTVLNAANEIAVQAFLDRLIRFTDIATTVEHTLSMVSPMLVNTLDVVLQADEQARAVAREYIGRLNVRAGVS